MNKLKGNCPASAGVLSCRRRMLPLLVTVLVSAWLDVASLCNAQVFADRPEVQVTSRAYQPHSFLTVETDLVQIDVVVRDKEGRIVPDLTRKNFQLFDEGVERNISALSVERSERTVGAIGKQGTSSAASTGAAASLIPPSRFVALFFDDVNTQDGPYAGSLRRAQIAAEDFLATSLSPGSQVGIFTASGTDVLDFTADPKRLIEALKALKPHLRVSEKGPESCPTINPYKAYLISQNHDRSAMSALLAEAGAKNCPITVQTIAAIANDTWARVRDTSVTTLNVIDHVVSYLGQRSGNKVLVLTSPGFMTGTLQEKEDQLVTDARRAGVVINALDAKGVSSELPAGTRPEDWSTGRGTYPEGYVQFETMAVGDRLMLLDAPMRDLSARTGGVFFHDNNNLKAGFRELLTQPDLTYRLTFKPDNVAADGRFHSVKVTLVGSRSHSITSSPGYFAPRGPSKAEKLRSRLDAEVRSQDEKADFPVDVAAQETARSGNERTLTINTHFDIAQLRFPLKEGRRVQNIILITALLDSRGNIVAAKKGTMSFALEEGTFARLSQSGVNAKMSLEIPFGSYTLRAIVQDQLDGEIACLTRTIDVH